jgi:putative alpha-1,2-mannosidase
VAKLNTFFTQLNATRFGPYDWAGNEPAMSAPYDYDYAGEPWGTQSVVRRIMTSSTPTAPVNEPGEDDLGALSSWYVWSALGLYPETPGVADLAMTSPLFPKAVITEGDGHRLTIVGTHAPDTFIQRAPGDRFRPVAYLEQALATRSEIRKGATLSVDLGCEPEYDMGHRAVRCPSVVPARGGARRCRSPLPAVP